MITLYIIFDEPSKRHYVGITDNLGRRLREHKRKESAGSRALGIFKLIYKEEFSDYPSARKREKYLKTGKGREWIKINLSGPAIGG